MADTHPPLGGTPGGKSNAAKNDPGDSSPGAPPGVKGDGWATEGFLVETPPDTSASQGDSDILVGSREQCDPKKRYPRIEERQRGDIEPLESEWV